MQRLFLAGSMMLALAAASSAVEPSSNKGRAGTYKVETTHAGYNYYVYVPKSYSDKNPAGLHVFFHGQSSQGGAPYFDLWSKDLLDAQNLIGINMQYMDGNNQADTSGKVAAAIEAITQVNADYKIVRGRGVVSSFSGGGLPHAMLTRDYGKGDEKSGQWPFSHAALYGSNYFGLAKGLAPMSWFLGLGTGEWAMGGPTLGHTQIAHTEELYEDALAGRCPDVYLKITKGKGHEISPADVATSAEVFARSDLAIAPFLYEPDFAGTALEPVVRKANQLDLGGAASDLKRVLSLKSIKPDVLDKASYVGERIEKRVDAVLALSKELSENDPVLWQWYGKTFAKQLAGHPRIGELKKLLPLAASRDKVKEKEKDVVWVLTLYGKHLKAFFPGGPTLGPDVAPQLEKVVTKAGEKSVCGRMAAEFLLLR